MASKSSPVPKAYADGIPVWCSHDEIVDIVKLIPNPKNPFPRLKRRGPIEALELNDQHDIFSGHQNELKLFGDVAEKRFIGIIDRVWPSQNVLLDWKTGSLKRNWKDGGYYGELDYCIQSHIYKCLCDQNLADPIHRCYFAFLGNQVLWTPVIGGFEFGSEGFETTCNNAINLAIDGIKSQEFHKNKNVLCKWCDYKEMCDG
jgi:hypothetical protein